LVIQPTVGVTVPTSNYSGSLSDYYSGNAYGLKPGINYGLVFSLPIGIQHTILDLGVNYSTLENSGSVYFSNDNIDLKQNLLTVYIGASYFPYPNQSDALHPYFGINFLYTNINGSVSFTQVQNVTDGSYDMSTDDRFGIGFKFGNSFSVGDRSGVEIEFDYNIINAFGKKFNSGGNSSRIGSYQSLNDDRDPFYSPGDIDHPISKSRMISVIQLTIGYYFHR
jgi:hypothetical protein